MSDTQTMQPHTVAEVLESAQQQVATLTAALAAVTAERDMAVVGVRALHSSNATHLAIAQEQRARAEAAEQQLAEVRENLAGLDQDYGTLLAESSAFEQQRDTAQRELTDLREWLYDALGGISESDAELVEVAKRQREQRDTARAALRIAKEAINPADRNGISLHEWNGRLKQATIAIDAALSAPEGR